MSSGYSVFKSKTSGKLAILVELIMIDSYSVTHSVKRGSEEGEFDVVIHTEITPTLDSDSYNILLSHNPRYFLTYVQWGADLTLSGHVHGGMVRIPFVGAVFSPDEGFFPKYDAGLYTEESGKSIVVSRGLGSGSRGFRLFNRPDLVVITLHSVEKGVD